MLRNLKQFNLPEIEEKILEFWRVNDIFKKTLALRDRNKKFIFYEGPPYANGRPGIHHVLARVFKDIVLRYKTMRGFYVPRKAGWDTHGLPIEIEAEKQLGIKSKKEIEKFGLALFNQKARESIWAHKDEWEKMTERIGYWLDLKNAYITYENYYIESLWWIFSEISKRKFLRKDYKVVPYCPRCETVLSHAELGQPGAYKKIKDPSIYVKFKIKNSKLKINEYLLVWTTTPWTLPSNVAIAVNPSLTYTKYKINGEYLWSYNPPPITNEHKAEAVEKISGKKLIGLEYEPLYPAKSGKQRASNNFYKVYGADFVGTEEGTGLVHIAPAFGEDDFNLIKKETNNFSYKDVLITVDDVGRVSSGFPGAGKFIKVADIDIIYDLELRGLVHKKGTVEHDYPFCWRCGTPLLYFARSAWFFEVGKLRKKLQAANKKINWIPGYIKEGRFGEWIKEARDWAISRERIWGTPLPVWECGRCDSRYVAGSLNDLDKHAHSPNKFLLLRHTEAEHNLKDFIASGSSGKNVPLTAKGKKDANDLAKKLSREKIDLIYTSPYKRAKDLARLIAKATGANVVVEKRIEELNGGVFNGRPVSEHKKYFKSPLEEFTKTPPGGENLNDVKKRMFSFVRDINKEHNGKTILIVSHGDPLWVLEGAMLNLSNEETLSHSYIKTGELRAVPLHNWPYNSDGKLDMHRPFIDEVFLKCQKCGEKMERVKEIADVWFDSGAMPFASVHYPFAARDNADFARINAEDQRKSALAQRKSALEFPADFIAEGIDQTRGWFYTLLAVSTLLGYKEPPYKNVICLGLINDKFGQKMSKSKGNIIDPREIIQKFGVDSVRWYFYTVNPPGEPKNFDEAEVKKTLNKFIMILYNSYVFYETYAPKNLELRTANLELNILDKWILARLDQTILSATADLEKYEIGGAAQLIEDLVDDLSRWYIRRSRRRLQKPENAKDYKAASSTLGYVLLQLSKLIAPFAPFFSEALYQSMRQSASDKRQERGNNVSHAKCHMSLSVHLEDWPATLAKKPDADLLKNMERVRDLAAKALAKRAEAGIKVRQPLASLKVKSKILNLQSEMLDILKNEINVKAVVFDAKIKDEIELDLNITPELMEEGLIREFARTIQELRQDAGLTPKDKIAVFAETSDFSAVLTERAEDLKKETGALKLELRHSDKSDAAIETAINGKKVWIGIKKL